MSNIAYHYTSLDSLYKIITTQSFLLTDLTGMNDPEEGQYSPQNFLNDLKNGKAHLLKDQNSINFFNILIPELESKKEDFFKLCKHGKPDPFAIALSQEPDSLLHWERYGDQLKGVCLSVDIDKLSDFGNSFPCIYQIRKVLYKNEDISLQILKDIINIYNSYSAELKKKKGIDLDLETIKRTCITQFAVQYQSMPYFIKREYWNEEGEIRLFYDHKSWLESIQFLAKNNFPKEYIDGISLIYGETGLKETEFKSFSTIRKCHRLSLKSLWDSDVFPEIRLGAFCKQNKAILKQFLKANGLNNTKISESKIKLR